MDPAVVFRPGEPVAEIVLNRPRVLNAMNMAWVEDFSRAAAQAAAYERAHVIVVRGEGRAFCAGLDLTMTKGGGMPPGFYPKQEEGFTALEAIPRLVIALIHGHCIGGGVQLAVACDIRIARDDAVFCVPAPSEGLFPGMAVWRLPRFVGLGRAMRLAISGEQINADEAKQMGLVDYICPKEGFEEAARAIIDRYAAVSPGAAGAAKRMMRRAFERDYTSVFDESRALLEERRASPEVLATAEAWERRRAARGTDGD